MSLLPHAPWSDAPAVTPATTTAPSHRVFVCDVVIVRFLIIAGRADAARSIAVVKMTKPARDAHAWRGARVASIAPVRKNALLVSMVFAAGSISAAACSATIAGTNESDAGCATCDASVSDAPADTLADHEAQADSAPVECSQLDPNGDACAGPCAVRYESPGCGDAAHPVCGPAIEDACAIWTCSCTGHVIVRCDYASEPWTTAACDGGTD
jgi:hypothetical protein